MVAVNVGSHALGSSNVLALAFGSLLTLRERERDGSVSRHDGDQREEMVQGCP